MQEGDLRGMWSDLTKNGDDYLLNSTTINPDNHAGMDVAVIKIGKPATKVVILQKITWTFDEAKQELTQTTIDLAVQRNNGEFEVQKDQIRKRKTGSVKMLSLNSERAVLQSVSMMYLSVPAVAG